MTQYIRNIVVLSIIGVAVYFVLQWGGGWEAISSNVLILIVLDILLIGALALVLRRARWVAALG